MAKAKGSAKVGGRVKGTPNKVTATLKERWADFVEQNFEGVQGWFDQAIKANPVEGLKLYLAFSERIMGKVSTSNVDLTSNGKTINAPTLVIHGSPPTDTD